jgi:hypothetical protein
LKKLVVLSNLKGMVRIFVDSPSAYCPCVVVTTGGCVGVDEVVLPPPSVTAAVVTLGTRSQIGSQKIVYEDDCPLNCCPVWNLTNISEVITASIIRAIPHCATSQKTSSYWRP